MKILVVGRGWTGNKVYNELLTRSDVSVNIIDHENAFSRVQFFDSVINCAGVTGVPNVDACESNVEETMKGNTIYPILLQRECEKHNVRFSHFSSGCIYTGEIKEVDAVPNFFGSIYSVSKSISDSYLKDKALVFRIRMPFTKIDEPKNYLTKIKHYAEKGKLLDSGPNSLTDLDEAVKVAVDLVLDKSPNGAYNLVNQGSITMRQLASLMKLNPKWFTDKEFADATKAGRSNCTIPAFSKMRSLESALKDALK